MKTEWKVEKVKDHELENYLNVLVENGWHIWPQLIFSMPPYFTIISSKEKED